MKRFFIFVIVLIGIFTLYASPAFAVSFTFDQIIKIISACKIDNNPIFLAGQEISLDLADDPGPVLVWFSDQDAGMLVLPKTNSNVGYAWNKINKKYLGHCMNFLVPTLSNYVDYDHGAYITFRITRASDSEDIALLEYSPKLKNPDNKVYGSTFSDANLFCQEVKRYVELEINK